MTALNHFFFSLLLFFLLLFVPSPIFAQVQGLGTMGVARLVEVKDKNVKDGMVISSSNKGPILADFPYDPQVMGVVSNDAAIVLSSSTATNGVPIISQGTVYVLVSSKEGPIKKGDLITTSTTPGVAVKAGDSGYVLGTALEDYSSSDPKAIGKIAAEFNLHYFNAKPTLAGSLTDIFKFVLLPTKEGPSAIYKYVVAALVAISSFVLGFMTFGRTAAKGVEALGRNPAAGRIIHLGIIFNVTIVVVIVLAGLTVSFLILRL